MLMVSVGFAIGFRVHTDAWHLLAGMPLRAAVRLRALLGVRHPRACHRGPGNSAGGGVPRPRATGLRLLGVHPGRTMPGWLQVFAAHQPVSVTASAVRALVLGGPTASYVWQSLAWSAGIVIAFAPLAVRLYRRT